jgi:hypothetical protein
VSFQTAQSKRVQAALDCLHTGYGSAYNVQPFFPRYSLSLLDVQRLLSVY